MTILRNVCCQLSNPGRGFSSPRRVPQTKKSPYLRTGSHLEYGGEGGIDSLRSPLRGSPLAGSRSVQLAAPVVEPRSGVLIPLVSATCEKKAVLAYELFLKYGGEGGLTRFARPCGAARSQARGLSNWRCQLSNPGRGFSSPPAENIKEKSPYLRTGSHLEYGGEGGIRTPDTLPYTHFPGVLLQPLGHLTILSFPLLSGTGANVGKYVSPVNQLFAKKARLDKLRATCSLNARNPFFLSPVPFPFSLGGNLLCWQTNRKQ